MLTDTLWFIFFICNLQFFSYVCSSEIAIRKRKIKLLLKRYEIYINAK